MRKICLFLCFMELAVSLTSAQDSKTLVLPKPLKDLLNNMVFVKGGNYLTRPATTDEYLEYYDVNHQVLNLSPRLAKLGNFEIMKYEVTYAMWSAIMGTDNPVFRNEGANTCPDCAAECNDYELIQLFIRRLNRITGENFRLPTEDEWEYAAVGGSRSHGYIYSGSNKINEVAQLDGKHTKYASHRVGQRKPNELGIYDMTGNLSEVCSDLVCVKGSALSNWQTVITHITRGGSHFMGQKECGLSEKGNFWNEGWHGNGLRLVKDEDADDLIGMALSCEKNDSLAQAIDYYQKAKIFNPYMSDQVDAAIARVKTRLNKELGAPEIDLYFPANARKEGEARPVRVGKDGNIFVSGQAIDPAGIATVTVNGFNVTHLFVDGRFNLYLPAKGMQLNTLDVIAISNKGIQAEKIFDITSSSRIDTSLHANMPKYFALLIAETDYNGINNWNNLHTTVQEMDSLESVLTENYNFSTNNIIRSNNKGREEILDQLKEISHQNSGEEYNLLICFGGHGGHTGRPNDLGYWVPVKTKEPAQNHEREEYLCNVDIERILVGSDARQILIISDACYSGVFARLSKHQEDSELNNTEIVDQAGLKSRYIMTSGDIEEVNAESVLIPKLVQLLKVNTQMYLSSAILFAQAAGDVYSQTHNAPTFDKFGSYGQEGLYTFEFRRR